MISFVPFYPEVGKKGSNMLENSGSKYHEIWLSVKPFNSSLWELEKTVVTEVNHIFVGIEQVYAYLFSPYLYDRDHHVFLS